MDQLAKENVYLIGVGGIGMSALARYFVQQGKAVAGYDRSTTPLTKRLQAEGVRISDFDEADSVPFSHRDKENTLVIYTPAIPESNSIRKYFVEEGFKLYKRAEVLGLLSAGLKTIAVSGTHGKTTISAMIAHLLKSSGFKLNAFLGGISTNYGSNLLINEGAELMVTEADEFDRSFLQLHPDLAIVSSVDSDHLDIYGEAEEMLKTYQQFVAQIKSGGQIITKPSIADQLKIPEEIKRHYYGIDINTGNFIAKNRRVQEGKYHFDLEVNGELHRDFICGLPGIHNIENATAAIAVSSMMGAELPQLKLALESFRGVKRRFDVHIRRDDFVYIDDYAHHPEEIRMLLNSVKELFPDKKITTIFQPHLFSRTRDLVDDFAEVLGSSDDLILLDIYPAREEPIEGVDSLWLSRKVKKADVPVCQKSHLMNILKGREVEVLLTVGAGDIDQMIEPIIDLYS